MFLEQMRSLCLGEEMVDGWGGGADRQQPPPSKLRRVQVSAESRSPRQSGPVLAATYVPCP